MARDAPGEVIRAAYKSLSQKYHPDKNPGDSEAVRIMTILNSSYDILSDKEKRRQHDIWIVQQEKTINENIKVGKPEKETSTFISQPVKRKKGTRNTSLLTHILTFWWLYLIIGVIVWSMVTKKTSTPPPGPKPYQSNPPQDVPTYVRPINAPNGEPWPISTGYIKGLPHLKNDGLSNVTIDNSRNDSDVFVKLVSIDGQRAFPVRQFFIPSFERFTLKTITPGIYDIRYRDLNSGHLTRSEAITLQEIKSSDGIQYSQITVTLFKVQDGNMETYDLSESEF